MLVFKDNLVSSRASWAIRHMLHMNVFEANCYVVTCSATGIQRKTYIFTEDNWDDNGNASGSARTYMKDVLDNSLMSLGGLTDVEYKDVYFRLSIFNKICR